MYEIKISNIRSKALNIKSLVSTIDLSTNSQNDSPLLIGSINIHALHIYRKNPFFQEFYDNILFCYIDGMPIIWMLKALGHNISSNYRITVLDWHKKVLKLAHQKKLTVALLGGSEGIAELASKRLTKQFPNISFITHHGYINTVEIPQVIKNNEIDILLVGMGMPREEIWILNNQDKLNSKVIIPVGGYFDYMAGKTYTPPRWTGRVGLEWFFRLISSPRRLAYRYLVEPWPVIFDFIDELFKKNDK